MLPEGVAIGINQDMILPFALMREPSRLEIGLEELLQEMVIE